MAETVFYMKSNGSRVPSTSVTLIQGADWFIDDLDRSYEIVEQGQIGSWICQRVNPKPTDWTGPAFLESVTVPMEVLKEDEQGRWIRLGAWDRIHWRQAVTAANTLGIAGILDGLRAWMSAMDPTMF